MNIFIIFGSNGTDDWIEGRCYYTSREAAVAALAGMRRLALRRGFVETWVDEEGRLYCIDELPMSGGEGD